jgi:pyruvate, orthophosphate dikinase
LNIGLNDDVVNCIIRLTGSKLFGLDLYRRFLHQFGMTVLGIRPSVYIGIEHQVMKDDRVSDIASLSESALERLVESFKEVTEVPYDGTQQLLMAIDAMYDWWVRHHPEEKSIAYGMSGIALIVQEMVYGNMRSDSSTQHSRGFHRSASSGSGVVYCTPFTRGYYAAATSGDQLITNQDNHVRDMGVLEVS